jgi:hypothetical protein
MTYTYVCKRKPKKTPRLQVALQFYFGKKCIYVALRSKNALSTRQFIQNSPQKIFCHLLTSRSQYQQNCCVCEGLC